MPNIFYSLEKKAVEANPSETILEVSMRAGIAHAHACGGNARCSTCRVLIMDGLEHCAARNPKEQSLAQRLNFTPDIRLACQTTFRGNLKLRRLVLDDEDIQLAGQQSAGSGPAAVGKEKQLAVLFADIRGFTPFAEALPPYDVVHVLNRYFNLMGSVINRNGGSIDNYMGDGLMALFGLSDQATAPIRAVRAGVEMLDAMEHLKPYLRMTYARSFEIGVGIHCGDVVVGTIGAQSLKRVTAIGDAVNLASRIEAANKQAGTRILISNDTYHHVRDQVRVGRTVCVSLPGKSGDYLLREILALSD